MPNLRDIKRRINSVESTKQITRTMEMVATAKIRRATERIVEATPYALAMVEVLGAIASRSAAPSSPLLVVRDPVKRIALIVVTSDRGLAGGFNSNILRAADRFIAAKRAEGVECDIIACGKKAIAYFKYRKLPLLLSFRDQSADPQISQAREIATTVIDEYVSGKVDQVVVFYNHAKNVADQVATSDVILPVEKVEYHEIGEEEATTVHLDESAKVAAAASSALMAEAKSSAGKVTSASEAQGDFDYEPSAEEVLDALLPSYVETRIFYALLDSAAGEQGARRKAMKSATDNATDMISTLTRVYNRARQGAITTEITEIVGGAAALEEE
ncbi:MAG: F0F1 ATP synthase subunit gamma [Eggerthellaceae bacterium]|jgi:F-type H+-transporting ATPase subunit gamma|nr:F0F1 ATP synthase subunit gamma [Eggerthellaceae bacterium]MDR2716075.1 F0F1 ATP synthase subunit gamma [Coriobacteriaceae bacterium]